MYVTRTGGIPIGFREVPILTEDFDVVLEWAKSSGFSVIDLVKDAPGKLQKVYKAGLQVGAVDLPNMKGIISSDVAKRSEAIAENRDFIQSCSQIGQDFDKSITFFTMMLPENPELPRKENFGYMVVGYSELLSAFEELDARMVIEGWPGSGCVCCTPEGFRRFFKECPSERMGINYDPSHLIRMNIDPLRFLRDFVDRVFHVHGKDTELLEENRYEYGYEIPAIFATPIAFGVHAWRYTIPGHGCMRWSELLRILQENGYSGSVSIELEDADFNDRTREGEKRGLMLAASFLSGC